MAKTNTKPKTTSGKTKHISTSSQLAIQWLSYAFWAWTIIAISYLLAIVVGYVIGDGWAANSVEIVAYGVAATLILLPIALVFDILYSKYEPVQKTGGASVLMIIHTVLYALIAVGALAATAFAAINALTLIGDATGSYIAIATTTTLFILFTALSLRVMRPVLFTRFRLVFRLTVLAVAMIASAWATVGPMNEAIVTKDSRSVRDAVVGLNSAVNDYVYANGKLPIDISQATDASPVYGFTPNTSKDAINDVVSRGLITYTPNVKEASRDDSAADLIGSYDTTYYYELCAIYTKDLRPYPLINYGFPLDAVDESGYRGSIDTGDGVKAGTQCYKLKITHTAYKN